MPAIPELIFDGPEDAAKVMVLAHGAGTGMDTPFMNTFATGLAHHGIRVARFEFPYMAAYRHSGKKRPPDREPILRETWLKVVQTLTANRLVIGGKSMGGRIASMIADEAGAAGLVCLGYPFHPVGKPDRLRVEHLQSIKTPALILQGTRDPFGSPDEVSEYTLTPAVRISWLEDGDHDFRPRRTSGRTEQQNLEEAIAWAVAFIQEL